jgi:hypothetical protein
MSSKHIDLTCMSAHVIIDRADRVRHIENSVGWGTKIVEVPDKKNETATATLTSTGVMVITGLDGLMITAWIANVSQAVAVWKTAKGDRPMPRWLWNVVNYNNNTDYWKNLVAA